MTTGGDSPAEAFERERPRLMGLAYRMTGSIPDAEDIVQEAWLRWSKVDHREIDRPPAWLITATSRLALDRLRVQRRRREDYVGPWLPDPIATNPDSSATADPERAHALTASLELGFLVVLDTLRATERLVFVLADIFAVPFDDIAAVVDRTPTACRQIASRARRKVREARGSSRPVDEGLLGDLVAAVALGDVERVTSLLAEDVVLVSDGGPNRRAARRPVLGPDRVARFLINLARRIGPDAVMGIEELNASPALVARDTPGPTIVTADEDADSGEVCWVRLVLNLDKLGAIEAAPKLL